MVMCMVDNKPVTLEYTSTVVARNLDVATRNRLGQHLPCTENIIFIFESETFGTISITMFLLVSNICIIEIAKPTERRF